MRLEVHESLWRYEAMTGLVDWESESDPGREDRDRAAYGEEYGLVRYPDGQSYTSYARIVRFLVEVCGHPYEESLEALVEHEQGMPTTRRTDIDSEMEARRMREGTESIIETLFHLKVVRLIHAGKADNIDYNWRVTHRLMGMSGSFDRPDNG